MQQRSSPTSTDNVRRADVDLKEGWGTTCQLATFAAGLRYEELPEDVRHQAKRIIVDTLACVIGAHPYGAAQIMEQTIAEFGGNGEARAIPAGFRTSAPMAAYVTAELANLLDLDDNLLNHTHFANCIVAAPLAAAEAAHVNGKTLIQAVIAAYEVSARVSLALPNAVDISGEWPDVEARVRESISMSHAVFGAAAGCGNVLGLDEETMQHAFGLAGFGAPVPACQKAMSGAAFTMNKYAPFGQIAFTANVAARLARNGMTGDTTVLDGPRGYWQMVGAEGFDWEIATGGLGSHWWAMETSFKLHPICTWNRQPLRALESIMTHHTIDPSLVDNVEVLVHSSAAGHPPWLLQDPADYLGTQMSHPWCIAMTLLGVPVPRWQQPDTIADPRARDLASRVRVGVEPTAQRAYYDQLSTHVAGGAYGVRRVRRMPGSVIVRMMDGQEYRATAEYGAGDPFTPETRATDEQLREKFLSFGELAVPRQKLEQACDALFALEGVDDVSSLVDLFVCE